MFALFFWLYLAQSATSEVILGGYDIHNTRNFNSDIYQDNINDLVLKWNSSMCGSATATPLVYGDRVCVPDYGGCFTCWDREDGSIIYRKNITADYGFHPGYIVRTTPTLYEERDLVILATNVVGSLLNEGFGAYMFAVKLKNGRMVWNITLDSLSWAIVTQSPVIYDDTIYIGTSSSESSSTLNASYPCCRSVGKFFAIRAEDGSFVWPPVRMIPEELSGVGKYSGASIWGSTPIIVGKSVIFGTGQAYQVPTNVSQCSAANPMNRSCVDGRVNIDSIVSVDRYRGEINAAFRATAADTFTIACFFGLPACQPGPALDYDITGVMYSEIHERVVATSKSGFVWYLDKRLNPITASILVNGSAAGGITWQAALQDDCDLRRVGVYTPNNNGANRNFTLPNGTVINYGAWAKNDGNGTLKWVTPSPDRGRVYGPVAVTNDIVFGSTYEAGTLVAMGTDDGEILWSFKTRGAMTGGCAIDEDEVYWPTGPGTNFFPNVIRNQNDFLVFKLKDCDGEAERMARRVRQLKSQSCN